MICIPVKIKCIENKISMTCNKLDSIFFRFQNILMMCWSQVTFYIWRKCSFEGIYMLDLRTFVNILSNFPWTCIKSNLWRMFAAEKKYSCWASFFPMQLLKPVAKTQTCGSRTNSPFLRNLLGLKFSGWLKCFGS